jgi:hypothetical protein
MQTPSAFGFATNHSPAGRNFGEGWPQAVVLFA